MNIKDQWIKWIDSLQGLICKELEKADGKALFLEDKWKRAEGGGGRTRVMSDGNVFEKGGVNTSVVFGDVTDTMRSQLKIEGEKWFACGLSLVMHPVNPNVPTVHANWRYFELYDRNDNLTDSWFGGGTDLTPYYLFEEDVVHFHTSLKKAIDPFGESLYPLYKKNCDEYFTNKHRDNEMRGVGGVFYDHVRPADEVDAVHLIMFQQSNGLAFLEAYLPIVEKRKDIPYNAQQVEWQEMRRGRYVEFNLIHDKGTIFGLKTNGRTESILMSLPPRARWTYDYKPQRGSEEDKLLQACLVPRDWLGLEISDEERNEWSKRANSC